MTLRIEVPPGRKIEDKLPIGVFDSNNILVALLDVLRGYRIEFEWWRDIALRIRPASKTYFREYYKWLSFLPSLSGF